MAREVIDVKEAAAPAPSTIPGVPTDPATVVTLFDIVSSTRMT